MPVMTNRHTTLVPFFHAAHSPSFVAADAVVRYYRSAGFMLYDHCLARAAEVIILIVSLRAGNTDDAYAK
jgi:hypothetical protein